MIGRANVNSLMVVIGLGGILLGFQNCSKVKFQTSNSGTLGKLEASLPINHDQDPILNDGDLGTTGTETGGEVASGTNSGNTSRTGTEDSGDTASGTTNINPGQTGTGNTGGTAENSTPPRPPKKDHQTQTNNENDTDTATDDDLNYAVNKCGLPKDLSAIMVTIDRIDVHLANGGYVRFPGSKTAIDLLSALKDGLAIDMSNGDRNASGNLVSVRIHYSHNKSYVIGKDGSTCELKTNCGQRFLPTENAEIVIDATKSYLLKSDFQTEKEIRVNRRHYTMRAAKIGITSMAVK